MENKTKGPGRPELDDPKKLFPSFRVRVSKIEALKAKAKKEKKTLGELTNEALDRILE